MASKIINQDFCLSVEKIIVILILPTIITANVAVVISSQSATATIISPAGLSAGISAIAETNNPNYLGNGAKWLKIAGLGSPPSGYTATFQSPFYSYCTVNTGFLQVSADDKFQAYFNGILMLSANSARILKSRTISLGCGLNYITISVVNGAAGPMALVFSIDQEQAGCNNCCTDNMPFCLTC